MTGGLPMPTTVKGYKEIREIYDKLNDLRNNTQQCAQKISDTISQDQWLENDLLDTLKQATTEMKDIQNSLKAKLQEHGIAWDEKVSATGNAIEDWKQKEIEKCLTVELKKILDTVCMITYDGDVEEIKAALATVQKEASELAKNITHYAKNKERIRDFQSLLKWVETKQPISLNDSRDCQKKFGDTISYAIMLHLFKLSNHPAIPDNAVLSEKKSEPEASVETKEADITTSLETKEDKLPECCYFDDTLHMENKPLKNGLTKSINKFKREFNKATLVNGGPTPNYGLLAFVIDMFLVFPSLLALENDAAQNEQKIQGFNHHISTLYNLGLVKKLTIFRDLGYTLNTDNPELLALLKKESMKKIIGYHKQTLLNQEGKLPDIVYVQNYIKQKMWTNVVKLDMELECRGELNSCVATIERTDCSLIKCWVVGFITAIFSHESEKEDMEEITNFLDEKGSSLHALIVAVQSQEEITYWNNKLSAFHLPKIAYYDYVKNTILDRDGKENIPAKELMTPKNMGQIGSIDANPKQAQGEVSAEIKELPLDLKDTNEITNTEENIDKEDKNENGSVLNDTAVESSSDETTEIKNAEDLPQNSRFDESSIIIESNDVNVKLYNKSVSRFKSEFDKAIHCISHRYTILGFFIDNLLMNPVVYKKRHVYDGNKNETMFNSLITNFYQAGLTQKITIGDTVVYTLNRTIAPLCSIYKSESIKKWTKYEKPYALNLPSIPNVWYMRAYIKLKFVAKFLGDLAFGQYEGGTGSCVALFGKYDGKSKDITILKNHYVGMIISLFDSENLKADLEQIASTLEKYPIFKANALIAIKSQEEIDYWNKKAQQYGIKKHAFYDYMKDILVDKDGNENISIESLGLNFDNTSVDTETVEENTKQEKKMSEESGVEDPKNNLSSVDITPIKQEIDEPESKETGKDGNDNKDDIDEVVTSDTTVVEHIEEQTKADTIDASTDSIKNLKESEIAKIAKEETSSTPTPYFADAKIVSDNQISEMIKAVADQFDKHHIAEGMLMLHGIYQETHEEEWALKLLNQLSFVLGDPLYSQIPVKESPYRYWNYTVDIPGMDMGHSSDFLNAASMIRYFFKPAYDNGDWHWETNQVWNQINDDSSNVALQSFDKIKSVINCFRTFLVKNKKGFGLCLGGQGKIQEQQLQELDSCEKELCEMKQKFENRKSKPSEYKRVVETYDEVCRNSNWYLYVSNAKETSVDDILAFCNDFAETPISSEDITQNEEIVYTVSGAKIDEYMDKVWDGITVARRQTERFKGNRRSSLKVLLTNAFNALGRYAIARSRVEYNDGTIIDSKVISKTTVEAENYCTGLIGQLQDYRTSNTMENIAIFSLKYLVKTLLKSFNANYQPMEFYEPFLLSNYVELDERYIPCIDFSFQIPELSLYNRCLKHIELIEKEKLTPCNNDIYSNLAKKACENMDMGLYKLLLRRLGKPLEIKEEEIIKTGGEFLAHKQEDFRSELELAYNYGKLTQKNEIESYEKLSETVATHLQGTYNFGLFQVFKNACMKQIDVNSRPRQDDLSRQFANLKEGLKRKISSNHETCADYPILDEIQKCLDNRNFSVAEDYMRQCQDGNLTEIKSFWGGEPEEFKQFMDSYQSYYSVCSVNKKRDLDYTLKRWFFTTGKSSTYSTQNSTGKRQVRFVKEWDTLLTFNKSGYKPSPANFLEMLGYPESVKVNNIKELDGNCRSYDLSFESEPTHQYVHTFKQFGSGIFEKGLKIVTFAGAHTPENIVNELSKIGIDRQIGTICLLDSSMTLADRRKLAELMKCSDTMYNVIVIDRVLALYLSQFEKLTREDKMMKLCMPFANATPFNSKGFIAPEMFIGRTKELADIRNMDGPNLVYGGRQLGKSILLRQVSLLDNRPSSGYYAFYFDMKGKEASDVLEAISNQLIKAKLLSNRIPNWDSLEDAMVEISPKITQLILLIDEADSFIVSSSKEKDHPIEVLRVTQNKYHGMFKFVLAGLHNVIRYDKSSLASNTVYGQLEHINIRPFEYTDACDLLLRPLSYLGFTISNPAIVSTILAKTNYFPGLIQYYGMKLLESVKIAYRKHNFKNTNTPPYELNETYLKNLMEDDSFLKEIEDKFMITLRVDKDDDNFYHLLTLGVAWLYVIEDKPVTLDKLKAVLSKTKVSILSVDKLYALLDEMKELNILRSVNENEYVFNRYSFYSMLGGEEEITEALSKYEKQWAEQRMERTK